jgi:hypothetical protein
VYTVVFIEAVFIIAGVQVPLIGVVFDDIFGNIGAVSFTHKVVGIVGKVGVIIAGGFTVITTVFGVPTQLIIEGVMVYVTVPVVFPEQVKVWVIVFPEPFEKPITFDEIAVQFIVAFASEGKRVIAVVAPEQIEVNPEGLTVRVVIATFIV